MNEVGHLLRICGHVLPPDDLSAFAAFAAAGRGRITGCQLGGAGNGATLEHRWRTGITAHADGEYTVTVSTCRHVGAAPAGRCPSRGPPTSVSDGNLGQTGLPAQGRGARRALGGRQRRPLRPQGARRRDFPRRRPQAFRKLHHAAGRGARGGHCGRCAQAAWHGHVRRWAKHAPRHAHPRAARRGAGPPPRRSNRGAGRLREDLGCPARPWPPV